MGTPIKSRRSVAVLGFKNLAGNAEQAWLSTAIAEMLTTELAAGEQLRTIPGESVAQMKVNLSLPDTDSFSKETLARIRQNLGTDDVILGSYLPVGNGLIRLDLRLQDAVAGETLASVSAAKVILVNSQNRAVHLDSAIVAARSLTASNEPAEAKTRLKAALSEATKTGFVPEQLEARLALGEIEMKSGKSAVGRARLEALEKDATAKGFLLIARKAAAAAKG